jgi:Uma2 family endonuclease
MAISQRRMTLEEFLKLPEEKPALELIGGEVRQKVSPKGPHGTLQTEVALLIDGHARPRRSGRVFTETRATFGGESHVPDLIYYSWDRVPRTPEGRIADDFLTPPDVAIEITSPGQSISELERLCRWYVEHGVRVALLTHPRRETVTLFRAGSEPIRLAGDQAIELDDILPGLVLTPRQVFGALY